MLPTAGATTCIGTSSSRTPNGKLERPTISSVTPLRSVEGGRVTLAGSGFPVDTIPEVTVGGQHALVAFASSSRIVIAVPTDVEPGPAPIRIENLPGATAYVSVGGPWAT